MLNQEAELPLANIQRKNSMGFYEIILPEVVEDFIDAHRNSTEFQLYSFHILLALYDNPSTKPTIFGNPDVGIVGMTNDYGDALDMYHRWADIYNRRVRLSHRGKPDKDWVLDPTEHWSKS